MGFDTNTKKFFQQRRATLLKKIGSNGIAILAAAKEHPRNANWVYPYRQSSDFYYLTNFVETGAFAVFIPGRKEGEFIIFSEEYNAEKEMWFGPIIGQKKACEIYGADQAFSNSLLDKMMLELIGNRDVIYFDIGRDLNFDARITGWVNQLKASVRSGINPPHQFADVSKIISEMRLRKDPLEIELMRKSAAIAKDGHLRAMKSCQPGKFEYEIAAELIYEFTRQGGMSPSFETIVGGGANSCVLHYNKNDQILNDGDLVVVDAGVEYQYYASDITRTYPINGRFTAEQKAVYEIVLQAQTSTINMIKPGITWLDLQHNAQKIITEGLVSLGILQGNVDELFAAQAFKPFYWHHIGHWLGIDDHDVGSYRNTDSWRSLEAGIVTTVEPGIYIAANNPNVDKKWWNIGIRIEDDILVTETGFEVLTKGLPKTVEEIESVMRG